MERLDESIVYLSLGSNDGDRIENLRAAIELITARIGEVRKQSSFYQTPPLGFEAETDFINCCLEISTVLSPINLLKKTQEIEHELGRKHTESVGYSSRTIDIDTIIYGTIVMQSPELTLPHPRFRERKFVLVPLCELNKIGIDPITHLNMSQLLANCKDPSRVEIYTVNKK